MRSSPANHKKTTEKKKSLRRFIYNSTYLSLSHIIWQE